MGSSSRIGHPLRRGVLSWSEKSAEAVGDLPARRRARRSLRLLRPRGCAHGPAHPLKGREGEGRSQGGLHHAGHDAAEQAGDAVLAHDGREAVAEARVGLRGERLRATPAHGDSLHLEAALCEVQRVHGELAQGPRRGADGAHGAVAALGRRGAKALEAGEGDPHAGDDGERCRRNASVQVGDDGRRVRGGGGEGVAQGVLAPEGAQHRAPRADHVQREGGHRRDRACAAAGDQS
mmetsp:Transcript_13839/g.46773  ORF Transcript_13839/g.46773 Transcript_13839/m.46773 type:complete len:235 (+) Transcript_13839:131-835(+)